MYCLDLGARHTSVWRTALKKNNHFICLKFSCCTKYNAFRAEISVEYICWWRFLVIQVIVIIGAWIRATRLLLGSWKRFISHPKGFFKSSFPYSSSYDSCLIYHIWLPKKKQPLLGTIFHTEGTGVIQSFLPVSAHEVRLPGVTERCGSSLHNPLRSLHVIRQDHVEIPA